MHLQRERNQRLKNKSGITVLRAVKNHQAMINATVQRCIQLCYECATACDDCASSCLQEEDVKMMTRCIELDIDCAQMCRTAAALMGRNSEYKNEVCDLCALICEACADECDKHEMEHCRRCADLCRRCADACKHMVAAA